MSSIQTRFLPFGQWSPDSVEFEGMEMEIASNFTPSYGAFRPIEKLATVSSVTDSEAMNGGISHIVSEEEPPVRMRPDTVGSVKTSTWWDEGFDIGDTANEWHAEKLADFYPVDSTYIRSDGENSSTLSYVLGTPLVDPVPVGLGDLVLKFRVRLQEADIAGTNYVLDYQLWEMTGAVQIGTTQTTAAVTGEWLEVEWEIPVIEFPHFVGNWDAIELRLLNWRFTPAIPPYQPYFQADKDEDLGTYSAIDDAGDARTEDFYLSIRKGLNTPGPALNPLDDYIQSPEIPPGQSELVGFRWATVPRPLDPTPDADWFDFDIIAAASEDNTEITVRVLQPVAVGADPDDDEVFFNYGDLDYRIVHSETITALSQYDAQPPTTADTHNIQVVVGEHLERFNFDSPFYLSLTTKYAGGGAGKTTHAVPTSNWQSNSNGVTGAYSNVDNTTAGGAGADDGTVVSFAINSGVRATYLGLGDRPAATSKTGHKIMVRARWVGTDSGSTCKAQLYRDVPDSPLLVQDGTFNPGTSFAWHTVNLGPVSKDFDYSKMGVKVFVNTPTSVLEVSEVYYQYPGDSGHARIYQVAGEKYFEDFPIISWVGLDSLNPVKTNARDRSELYAGNNSALYQIKESGWTDVTRLVAGPDTEGPAYSDLTALTSESKIWDFCTFGDKIIATNFADEMQIKDVTDATFLPLFGTAGSPVATPYAPRARYCAVVGSQLVLADINTDNYGTHGTQLNYNGSGKPFQLWVSAPMEPNYFDVANLFKQSALFSLVGQPGAITGLVGGEWGTVFKRNSIWRMQYVGLPQIMQLDQIAIGQGCSHPQSIVQVGQDIFFWGNGGIFAVSQGSQLVRISGQRIEKAIFDTLYEDIALAQDFGTDSVENDSRVRGAYDAYSGTVWWLYRGKEDSENKLNRFLCYSTQEDRFTHGLIEDMDLSLILGRMNVTTADNFLNRGFIGLSYQDTTSNYQRLSDTSKTYEGTLKTKILSSSLWGFNIGQEIEIQAIRPIYKADPDDYRPRIRLDVEAAQDPTMQRDRSTKTVSSINEDRDGWIPLGTPVSGEFWRFTIYTPEFADAQLKEMLGIQIKLVPRGDY